MSRVISAISAAEEIAAAHGIQPDRREILQAQNTVVVRLTGTLVARVGINVDGPRHGSEWLVREIAVASFLARVGAPVIPLHPKLPPGPHHCHGFDISFWKFVQGVASEPEDRKIGETLFECHRFLREFLGDLPVLGILRECESLLDQMGEQPSLLLAEIALLRHRLAESTEVLRNFPSQPLHGDAHRGNFMHVTEGVLWTDWEDAFLGPVEWDLAAVIWDAKILEQNHASVDSILSAYCEAGGCYDEFALHHSLIARAAVMCAWYPILYPHPPPERKRKLQARLDWLASV